MPPPKHQWEKTSYQITQGSQSLLQGSQSMQGDSSFKQAPVTLQSVRLAPRLEPVSHQSGERIGHRNPNYVG